jgi:hypothetical protein
MVGGGVDRGWSFDFGREKRPGVNGMGGRRLEDGRRPARARVRRLGASARLGNTEAMDGKMELALR